MLFCSFGLAEADWAVKAMVQTLYIELHNLGLLWLALRDACRQDRAS